MIAASPHAGVRLAVAVACVSAAASEVPRLLLAAESLPAALRPFVWSDLHATFLFRGLALGRLPYLDVPFEYPPLFGYAAGAFVLLTRDALAYLTLWSSVVVVAAGLAAYALARAAGPALALRYWSLSPQLLLLAGVNVDVVPAALTIAAVLLARAGRAGQAQVALALGAATKLFPAVAAPVLVLQSWGAERRAAIVGGLAFSLVFAGLSLPAALAPHSAALGFGFYAYGIGANVDSVWGLLEAALRGLGLAQADTVVVGLTLVGLAASYVLLVVPRARRGGDPAVAVALAVLVLLLWTRRYSPQYSLWLLPFFALLRLPASTFALLAFADILVFLTIYPLTLVAWAPSDVRPAILLSGLAAGVVLRHLALLATWRDVNRADALARMTATTRRSRNG